MKLIYLALNFIVIVPLNACNVFLLCILKSKICISDDKDFSETGDFVDLHSYSFVQEVKLIHKI
jgi:hypothetical protein